MQNHVFRRENSQMLKAIKIEGLFSRFDYDIEMKEEGITILTGPNGFGKSTIFSLIEAVAAADADAIRRTSFKKRFFFARVKTSRSKRAGNSFSWTAKLSRTEVSGIWRRIKPCLAQ